MQSEQYVSHAVDMALVQDCLGGDSNAFRPLMEKSECMVRGMVMNLVHDAELAEDMAQQSFLTAFERLHQFKGNAKFSTWVCQIALNKCRDHLRKHQPETVQDDCVEHQAELSGCPENQIMEKQRKQLINQAISKLKLADREIVTFKYLCGYSYEVIAQTLGCTVANAKVRSLRAREKLKVILTNMGVELHYG